MNWFRAEKTKTGTVTITYTLPLAYPADDMYIAVATPFSSTASPIAIGSLLTTTMKIVTNHSPNGVITIAVY